MDETLIVAGPVVIAAILSLTGWISVRRSTAALRRHLAETHASPQSMAVDVPATIQAGGIAYQIVTHPAPQKYETTL